MKQLTSEHLFFAFSAGSNALIAESDILNQINVFPVADGDTGSNMAHTLSSIITESKLLNTVHETMESIAYAALLGARGNSGILFAQFVNGFAQYFTHKTINITIDEFINAMSYSVKQVYESLQAPQEGTIITVMYDWAESLRIERANYTDFPSLFDKTMGYAYESLEKTRKIIKKLTNHNFIDAGARGFVLFLQGFAYFIQTGISVEKKHVDIPKIEHEPEEFNENCIPHMRYCTEMLIRDEQKLFDISQLRENLKVYGDSLVVVGSHNVARIHIHTNEPAVVFRYMRDNKFIFEQQKVDDMYRQFQMIHHQKSNIAIVVDSSFNIPAHIRDELQIHLIPNQLSFGNQSFINNYGITEENFYEMLQYSLHAPKTATPLFTDVSRILHDISAHYDSIICFTLNKELSGTYNLVTSIAKKITTPITIVESVTVGYSQGMIVEKVAQELITEQLEHNTVLNRAYTSFNYFKTYLFLPNIHHSIRHGRIKLPRIFRFLGFFSILLRGDKKHNAMRPYKISLSSKHIYKVLLHCLKTDISTENPIERISVCHAHNEKGARILAEHIYTMFGIMPVIEPLTSILGVHSGIGALNVNILYEKKY